MWCWTLWLRRSCRQVSVVLLDMDGSWRLANMIFPTTPHLVCVAVTIAVSIMASKVQYQPVHTNIYLLFLVELVISDESVLQMCHWAWLALLPSLCRHGSVPEKCCIPWDPARCSLWSGQPWVDRSVPAAQRRHCGRCSPASKDHSVWKNPSGESLQIYGSGEAHWEGGPAGQFN